MSRISRKIDDAMEKLLTRQDYLVTQANDLARAFGNLSAFEHRLLDFCFSFVQKDDDLNTSYQTTLLDAIRHLGINRSGRSYQQVAHAFKSLNEKTPLYLHETSNDDNESLVMTTLFDYIRISKQGSVDFQFSRIIAPYVFQLKKDFYSFKLAELSNVKSKYTLILMKLWNANSYGKLNQAIIKGSLEEWEEWFLGMDEHGEPKRWSAGRFKQKVLNKALDELTKLYPNFNFLLEDEYNGRKVIGYHLTIIPSNDFNIY